MGHEGKKKRRSAKILAREIVKTHAWWKRRQPRYTQQPPKENRHVGGTL